MTQKDIAMKNSYRQEKHKLAFGEMNKGINKQLAKEVPSG